MRKEQVNMRVVIGIVILAFLLAGAAAAAPTPASPRVIRIVLEEYKVTPATVSLKAGEQIRLEIVNAGTVQHQFRSDIFRGVDVYLRTPGFDTRSERMEVIYIRPRNLVTIEFARRTAGEYAFWCSERANGKRHRDLGERGKFVVSP